MRSQGRTTQRKLRDAGLRVFARRGFHETRVDDIVRAARTSHGTFYLYFANKEDLLRELALECSAAIERLADDVPAVGPDPDGAAELRSFLDAFFELYAHYGVVIRAWMESQVTDGAVDQLGVAAFTQVAQALRHSLRTAGAVHDEATVAALTALLERTSYAMSSRDLGFDHATAIDTLTIVVHRAFFNGAAAL